MPRRTPCWPIVFACLLLLASSAFAGVPVLYHSPADDGARPTSTPVEPGTPAVTLFLYLDPGNLPSIGGSPCVDGDGDELCGWKLDLQVSGSASVQAFLPDAAQDVVAKTTSQGVVATGGDAIAGELGPIRLGELALDVVANDWSVSLGRGSAVDASFGLMELPPAPIAVPEPGADSALVAGAIALLGVSRVRGRRRLGIRPLSVALSLALFVPIAALAQDADADGVLDESDNCVYTANPLQEDGGGLQGAMPDGIGDACQCGDLNGDGRIDLLDAALYQRALAGVLPVALEEDRCSVIGGRLDCEPNDRQAMRQGLVGLAPGVSQVCQAAQAVPPLPARIAAAGDSITQAFAANCTCNTNVFCLLCPALGDKPQYSWFNGSSIAASFYGLYGGTGSGITASRVSVSGAEMTAGADNFASQVDDILSLVPVPDLVVVELGGNDICSRTCVDASSCSDPLYDDATWTAAIEAGLDKLVGYGHPTSLPAGATVYLLGVPRVQDLHDAGVAKQQSSSSVDCEAFWDEFDVCRVATVDIPAYGEDLPTRRAAVGERIRRYNEILRDLALAYSTNGNGKNPNGIEVVADYVNETIASIGTTSFGPSEINGGDCFHPSPSGQAQISTGAWYSNPR